MPACILQNTIMEWPIKTSHSMLLYRDEGAIPTLNRETRDTARLDPNEDPGQERSRRGPWATLARTFRQFPAELRTLPMDAFQTWLAEVLASLPRARFDSVNRHRIRSVRRNASPPTTKARGGRQPRRDPSSSRWLRYTRWRQRVFRHSCRRAYMLRRRGLLRAIPLQHRRTLGGLERQF